MSNDVVSDNHLTRFNVLTLSKYSKFQNIFIVKVKQKMFQLAESSINQIHLGILAAETETLMNLIHNYVILVPMNNVNKRQ